MKKLIALWASLTIVISSATFAQFGYGYGWGGTYISYPIGSWPATVTNNNTTPTTVEIKNYIKRVLQVLTWENSWNGWNTDGGTVTTTEEGLVLPGSLPDTGAWN